MYPNHFSGLHKWTNIRLCAMLAEVYEAMEPIVLTLIQDWKAEWGESRLSVGDETSSGMLKDWGRNC